MAYFAVETYGSSNNQRRKLPYVGTISRQKAVVAAMSRGGLQESRFTSEGWSVLYHTQVMIYSHATIGHWIRQTLGMF